MIWRDYARSIRRGKDHNWPGMWFPPSGRHAGRENRRLSPGRFVFQEAGGMFHILGRQREVLVLTNLVQGAILHGFARIPVSARQVPTPRVWNIGNAVALVKDRPVAADRRALGTHQPRVRQQQVEPVFPFRRRA